MVSDLLYFPSALTMCEMRRRKWSYPAETSVHGIVYRIRRAYPGTCRNARENSRGQAARKPPRRKGHDSTIAKGAERFAPAASVASACQARTRTAALNLRIA